LGTYTTNTKNKKKTVNLISTKPKKSKERV